QGGEHHRVEGERCRNLPPRRGYQRRAREAPGAGGERRVSGELRLNPAATFPLIFAAPSGAGKTTIARALGARRNDIQFSISVTTRPPRPAERDGVDYHFRAETEFRALVEAGDLLEWAQVHGHFYGTPRSNLEEA